MQTNSKLKQRRQGRSMNVVIHLVLGLACLACIFPVLLVISISLTPENVLLVDGYNLIPREFTLEAYQFVLRDPTQILSSYGLTIVVTVIGTALGIWLTTSIAYVISRQDYRYRRPTTFFVFFTMVFNGGLAASYILITQVLHLKNSIWVLILPLAVSGWYVILMKGFLQGALPPSIVESAKIDGASELSIFVRIVLPISKSGIATIGLFLALNYWNDWYTSLLYVDNNKLINLQYLLQRILSNITFLKRIAASTPGVQIDLKNLPSLNAQMAMVLVAAGPMMIAFVFLQKYFVKGVTLGSIKG